MFLRKEDVVPAILHKELLRLARLSRDWVEVEHFQTGESIYNYATHIRHHTPLERIMTTGSDRLSLHATSIWLHDGPKVFRPSPIQCQALEQIEVRIHLEDYAQPYSALLIDLPEGMYGPFRFVLCHHNRNARMVSCTLLSHDHQNDITTSIGAPSRPMEESINKFDADCQEHVGASVRALRVAINSCLALVSYGCYADYLYPKERASDERLAREDSPRGMRARERLEPHNTHHLVSFNHDITLHRTENGGSSSRESTGREKGFHFRRGHWHTVLHGAGKAQRKLVLYPPVLVRADKLVGEAGDYTTTYKG